MAITSNHIEYLKQELEPEEGYPHKELYEFADRYILWHDLLEKYRDNPEFAVDPCFEWKDRYNSLVQRGVFFNNLIKLQSLRYYVKSEDQWKIALDLEVIPEEIANFEICYCWMNPGRWFSYDWTLIGEDPLSTPPFPSINESNAWNFVEIMFKKISQLHLPICNVEYFMNIKLS